MTPGDTSHDHSAANHYGEMIQRLAACIDICRCTHWFRGCFKSPPPTSDNAQENTGNFVYLCIFSDASRNSNHVDNVSRCSRGGSRLNKDAYGDIERTLQWQQRERLYNVLSGSYLISAVFGEGQEHSMHQQQQRENRVIANHILD